ncbi:NnrS family protein [Paracoccus sp. SCSIO 75233]|uniref:NnrS family protein n=1 Tax=Paracoccus sp. SCSIO 75233 TaxID=3017782 RepID=UPI0022F0A276|nr:NnrS family protein [Paracoccus sp. SCSIO 75233]WBU54543.1 NnrS family protein [Paracoccus sp. SCSIO 75233]
MTNSPANLFRAGWRVFFWAAGLWAVLSVAVWTLWLSGQFMGLDMAGPGGTPQLWHAHEMIFGYATAALGGFFLTAVPNWTGARAAPERFIAIVFSLWLAGRFAVWIAPQLPPVVVAIVDLAFLPVLAAKVLTQLLARPKPQNMMFLLLLSMVWTGNLLVHLDWIGVAGTEWQGLRGGLLTIAAMIAALGGRVTPAFTRNALLRAGRAAEMPKIPVAIDRLGVVLPIAAALSVLLGLPDGFAGVLALLAGPVAFLRLCGWAGWRMRDQPIVWALHLGYAMLALGLALWGLSMFGIGSETGALHILAIGAIGGMTLAVMSRASLGHSGRELVAPGPVALGYALLPVSALLRWAASAWPAQFYETGIILSGLLWIAAFALYLAALWPIFFAPRADGKPDAA